MIFGIDSKYYPAWVCSSILLLSACAMQSYEPAPLDPMAITQQRQSYDHADPAFREFLENSVVNPEHWPLRQWNVQTLTLAAYYFNPSIQLALSQVDIEDAAIGIARQRRNPNLSVPFQNSSEERASPWVLGLVGNFLFERSAKREARAAQAEALRNAALQAVSRQAWELHTQIHAGMVEYYAAIRQDEMLEQQRDIINHSLALITQRLDFGQASQFEFTSARLELQTLDLQLANQQYLINDAYHNLVSLTGLQVDKFKHAAFDFSDLQQHLSADAEYLHGIRADMIQGRFDLLQKLAEYDAFEAKLKLEIENQYPDLNLSPGFIFDQGDSVWTLGASWVLPLFNNNEDQVQKALAERKQKQYEIIALQTQLLNEFERKKQNYLDKLSAYTNSMQLLDALTSRAGQIEKQFKLGYSDKLSVLRTSLEIQKANQAIFDIELEVMRAAVRLEALTQSPLLASMQNIHFREGQRAVHETK